MIWRIRKWCDMTMMSRWVVSMDCIQVWAWNLSSGNLRMRMEVTAWPRTSCKFVSKVTGVLWDVTLWTQMQIKHAVTTSADMSPLGECEMQWMSWDEGSDRRSRSLICSSVMGVKDARMTFCKEREVGWCKNLSRADEFPLVKLSRFMSVVL